MRKLKIAYWAIIVFVLILFFAQNQTFFVKQKVSLNYNLITFESLEELGIKVFTKMTTPELQTGIFFFAFFFVGVGLAFLYCFFVQLKYTSRIRFLNKTCDSHLRKIGSLENELRALRAAGTPDLDEEDIVDISKGSPSSEEDKLKKK
ncbi:hypothetical protein QUF80_05030 [Desulfococcaceae bacterium HSG8]|nr:hypothetical protein [Desulfococcaceae bacterium HSG8]